MALANEAYSKMYVALLLVNLPINAYIMTENLILPRDQSSTIGDQLYQVATMYQQVISVFGVHLVLTYLSQRLHRPAKLLVARFARGQRLQWNKIGLGAGRTVRHRLSLALFIEAWHTRKRYGIAYGSFGLITLSSFTKVSFKGFHFGVNS